LRWLIGEIQPGVFKREFSSGNSELREAPTVFCPPEVHELLRFEVFDLGRDLTGIRRRVERCDVIDGRTPSDQAAPEGVLPDPVRGDDSQAGDDDATATQRVFSFVDEPRLETPRLETPYLR
jgi:hypothetical protein